VSLDLGLRRFKVAVQVPDGDAAVRRKLLDALRPPRGEEEKLLEVVEDPRQAEWLVRLEGGKVQLVEASANRAPFALPPVDDPKFGQFLRLYLGRVFRARNLIATANRFEEQRYQDRAAVVMDVEVLRHEDEKALGRLWPRPANGWVFHPGDLVSFRIHNRSPSLTVDVTLLLVGSDFQIDPYYPKPGEVAKSLKPGESIDTPPPPGSIPDEPPFGPECLVVIAAPVQNPPLDFTALAQGGLTEARAADKGKSLESPLGELLASALFGSGSRGRLTRTVAEQHGMRVLTWRTEAARPKAP